MIALRSLISALLWWGAGLSLLALAREQPKAALVVAPLVFVGLAVANAIDLVADVLAREATKRGHVRRKGGRDAWDEI